jgi:hypothetical protein
VIKCKLYVYHTEFVLGVYAFSSEAQTCDIPF